MKNVGRKLWLSIGLVLISTGAAMAATQEELLTIIFGQLQWILVAIFVVIVIVGVYFSKSLDRRTTPLYKLFERGKPIHSIRPDATVTECVQLMTTNNIGALVVMNGSFLSGIFTERDALNKVLAGGLDPRSTTVSDVMTKDPCFLDPAKTVGDAIELMTLRRFRHLPIVEGGRVLAVLSSGDLTQWVGQFQEESVQDLADLAELDNQRD